ncbi:MAG: hypothetical protein ACR2P1_14365 [Pseudomonadales bacterium]
MLGTQICKSVWLTVSVAVSAVAFATSVSAQEVDAKTMLERMSAEIAELDSFIVHGDAYADARLDAGQIIGHIAF